MTEEMKCDFDSLLARVRAYYGEKFESYGATPSGVDWNSRESQELRFEQLVKVCDRSRAFSIIDYGCGYGALADYLTTHDYAFQYTGFDITDQTIANARDLHVGSDHCQFYTNVADLRVADYTIASGIFNVKLQTGDEEWLNYVLCTLKKIANLSAKGFAFNALTKYSDRDAMRQDLFYADPLFLFDYCKRNFSKFVALLHDYPLYEFTLIVKH